MRRVPIALVLMWCACPAPQAPDAGQPVVDSGPPPPACDSPEDCRASGFPGVCRQNACAQNVPCADDLECGLAEACVDSRCVFTGCVGDADCPSGRCRAETFTCSECGEDSDCPFDRPVCHPATQKCVQCAADSQCPLPGPAHCEVISGQCQHCLRNEHCPNGLVCSGGACTGVPAGSPCPVGVACAEGLVCINVGTQPTCLQSCNAYQPSCPQGQICYTLTYSSSSSYVFEGGGLLGVCYAPLANARNYRDSCTIDVNGLSNCQPSLQCVPDSAQTATCRAFCDPGVANACPAPEICHRFPGDFYGRHYGLCFADNGWGDACTGDAKCRPGLSCRVAPDPSTFDELSTQCRFSVGTAPGLSPCADVSAADGGRVPPDAVCASGTCATDSSSSTAPRFCFAACATDSDCTVGARTGTCDGDFQVTSPGGFVTFVQGCRPACTSNASCEEYAADGGAFVCRPRLSTGSEGSGLKLNCGRPNAGARPAGAACETNSDCTSGFCSVDDARGVLRLGHCVEACRVAADCSSPADAGGLATGPLDCLPTAFLGYRGPDFEVGTPDDVISVQSVCTGATCNEDEDCSADGGARCVPDVSPADAGAYVLRCRPIARSGFREAGEHCARDLWCFSGACGELANGSLACFRACDPAGGTVCPPGLTCRPGAYRFTSTAGAPVMLDGCAP